MRNLARLVACQAFEILNEPFFAICHMWVVLAILIAGAFLDCGAALALIEYEIIERHCVGLVGLCCAGQITLF